MSATPTEPIRPSRRRRLFRAFVIGLAVVLSLGAIASWVCTRSWFLEAQIERTLERLLGGDVEIGEVRYEGAGVVMLDEVSVRSREHQGPAAEVLLIEQAKVVIDVDRLMDFDVQVLGVELDGVRLRLSEDQHKAGDFNFMALKPNWQRPYDIEHPLPPYVSITNATIEVGLHDGDRYHVVGTRSVRGEMAPMSEMDRALGFSLTETDPKTGDFLDSGLRIHGRWNVITNEYQSQIEGLELNADTYAMCPAMARFWWDRMQLEGRVSHVNIGWNTARSLLVEFDVEDVGLTLPIETESFWTRYHEGRIDPSADRPRMWVTSGRISLERDQLVLQGMAGEVRSSASSAEVVGVPYEVNLQIFNLPPLDWSEREQWLDGVLAETPFQMSVKLADFKLMRDASGQVPPVDLPMQVAQYLERFHIKEGQLSTEIELTRKQGDADGPAGIQTEGFAYIQKASGAVEAFPYPLDDVESYIQFDNERVTIHFLTGLGSDEAPIRVHGEITPPGENAAIALQITAVHIPLDDRFRSALGPEQQNVFDSLLHRPTAERLSAAGGLPDLASVATATAEYRDLVEELERQRWDEADPTEAQQLELERRTRRVRQLQRVIEAGPFQLGGSVNLELQVTRAAGEGEKASLDGRIDLRRVGLLADRFPYPITITGGTLDLSPKGVVIREGGSPEGASVTTPGGGTGWLTGRIDFVKGEGHVAWVPDLRLQILEDELNPLLYAAIPDVRESDADRSRPSAAEILRDLGLQGSLAYDGWIGKAADRTGLSFAVDIDLHDGFAAPAPTSRRRSRPRVSAGRKDGSSMKSPDRCG